MPTHSLSPMIPGMSISMAVLATFFSCASSEAQETVGKALRFEVASVKVTKQRQFPAPLAPPSGHIRLPGWSLSVLLKTAYALENDQLVGPAWLSTEHYDVEAVAPAGSSKDEVREMLRNLLLERFQIRLKDDTRMVSGLRLVVAAGGPKLNEVKGLQGDWSRRIRTAGPFIEVKSTKALAFALSTMLQIPVVDNTGLDRFYDIKVPAEAATIQRRGGTDLPSDSTGEQNDSIYSSIREMGLKLQSGKMPVRTIRIESASKIPIAN